MNELALLHIRGFRSAHFFDRRHYKHWGRDLRGVITDDQYLDLARRIGKDAAQRARGTHVARRGNNNLIVYAANALTQRHSRNCDRGMFMAIADCIGYGLLITLFAPDDGLAYFHRPDQRLLI